MKQKDEQPGALPEPTKSELEILQVIWQNGPSSVRFVNDTLNEQLREVNYSSTLKLMQIMLDKGLLMREIDGKNHIYRPAEQQEITQARVIKGLATIAFGGSPASLALRALGSGDTSAEELEQIKLLIQQIENQQNK
ncbi:MAG TPA: BlaI/MecI/CopY family transcriptional regulator [Saprospiraceae bacterium]|nr:BlaI/MecI/CopY family transcriptional regulator [Saprospiraceae bacterium]HPI06447.1 BlaI/MecI/CopY family transcriptional regulator [Saprospiraceae bacterium]